LAAGVDVLNLWSSGTLFFIPDSANPTPVRIGGLQDVAVSFKTGIKAVGSQYRHPIRFTVDNNSIEAVAKMAKIDGALFADILYGQSLTTGSRKVLDNDEATIPAGQSISPSFTGTFALDLGVVSVATGLPFTRVAAAPAAGQYTVAAGVYGFAAADVGQAVRISLAYDSATGKKLALANQVFQFAPTFAVLLYTTFNCKQVSFWLPYAVSEQLVMPLVLEQYAIPEFSFQAQMDNTDLSMGLFSFAE
jgi:hypothetical protein